MAAFQIVQHLASELGTSDAYIANYNVLYHASLSSVSKYVCYRDFYFLHSLVILTGIE